VVATIACVPKDTTSTKRTERLRALPWAALLRGGIVVGGHVSRLSTQERTHLARLIGRSRGWPGRLSDRERAELRKLLRKLDLRSMGGELMPLVHRGGRRRRHR
jgi:hypothetical protein